MELSPFALRLGEAQKTIQASKFSDAQNAFILMQGADGVAVPTRRDLLDLSDAIATKVQVLFHSNAADVLRKALQNGR